MCPLISLIYDHVSCVFCLFVSRREGWPGFSTYTCWQTLLGSTKRQSKDHAILSELYNLQMSNRLSDIIEDVQRIYKQVSQSVV